MGSYDGLVTWLALTRLLSFGISLVLPFCSWIRLQVDIHPVLLQVSMCYRSVIIMKEARDVPFLLSCQLSEPAQVTNVLLDYFLADNSSTANLRTRLWHMKDPGRASMAREPCASGGLSDLSTTGPLGGGNVVSSGQVTPDRAGTRRGLNSNARETEDWELVEEGVSLASLELAHQDRLLIEVKDSQGEFM